MRLALLLTDTDGLIMTDDQYFSILVWTTCVLMFACGVMALTEHPEWFGA